MNIVGVSNGNDELLSRLLTGEYRYCSCCGVPNVLTVEPEWKDKCIPCLREKKKPIHCIDCGEEIPKKRRIFMRDRAPTSPKRRKCEACARGYNLPCKHCGVKHPWKCTINEDLLRKAQDFCWKVHKNKDRDGKPHGYHCERVAQKMPNTLLRIIALLHDTLEDTDTTFEDLQMFGTVVANTVSILTHGDEPYAEYIERVATDYLAKRVKIADIQDNLNRGCTGAKLAEYQAALPVLKF